MKAGTSILYFDDEVVLLDIFREVFGAEYKVLTASTLREARQFLSQRPDIIISDWSMLDISGTDFLREVAKVCPDSFRIMLTGLAQVGDVFIEISSGVIQLFMAKPWTEEEMREALERADADRRKLRLKP